MNIASELFPTKKVYAGPWILDAKSLKELDAIITDHWSRLEDRRKTLIENDVESEDKNIRKPGEKLTEDVKKRLEFIRDNHRFSKGIRLLEIYCEDESTNKFENFDSAFRSRKFDAKKALGFSIKLRSADVEGDIVLESNNLRINIIPVELDASQNLFIGLRDWVERNEPTWWQRWWGKLANAGIWFYVILITVLGLLTILTSFLQGANLTSDIQAQTQSLLDGGISEPEIPRALELILKAQILDRLSFVLPSWLKTLFFIAVVASVMLPIRPKIVLGIGKGIKRLQMWKNWHRAVIAIWGIVLTYFIWPDIASFIRDLLRSF